MRGSGSPQSAWQQCDSNADYRNVAFINHLCSSLCKSGPNDHWVHDKRSTHKPVAEPEIDDGRHTPKSLRHAAQYDNTTPRSLDKGEELRHCICRKGTHLFSEPNGLPTARQIHTVHTTPCILDRPHLTRGG